MKKLVILQLTICLSLLLAAQDLRSLWKFQTRGMIFGSPATDGNLAYVGSTDSTLYAIEIATGKECWQFSTGGAIRSDALVSGQSVYIYSGNGQLYKLVLQTGKLIWSFKSAREKQVDQWDYYHSSPVLAGDRLIFGNGNGNIYALDTLTGRKLWSFPTSGAVHASPAVSGDTVFAGSYDGHLYALNVKTGKLIWKFKTVGDRYFPAGAIQKAVTLYKDAVVFGSRDFNIYAVDKQKGTGFWNWKEKGSWIVASPHLLQDNLYFGTSDSHRFYCIDAGSGEIKWNISVPMRVYGTAASADSIIYFGCFDGKLYGVDEREGKILRTFQTDGSKRNYATVFDDNGHFRKGFVLYGPDMEITEKAILDLGSVTGTPLIYKRQIIFGSTDGFLYALSLDGPN
ncbi:PQQ-binding-like beta-propeller repeat protein [Flavihumibacter solisilvae]|uniref:Pyrrolo-quinoline quinone repeat domain-containing protein n=1 Tax=Flavihumibacter solisilvae TaxID=1349421 RepID=A0A0C1IET7_9BACT|nr:PQQ-binding-like beta-propeller repeat protein [Flavihumibacter solisilvae]KIC92680.1 hypothetical protein OI18_21400 [Flavihumibacter solisilvae]